MKKRFNVTGLCIPKKHYMVNLTGRLAQIKEMVDDGAYFTIHRARQYGKTTLLHALESYLKTDYLVINLDFQKLGASKFENENIFSLSFAAIFLKELARSEESAAPDLMQETKKLQDICESRDNTYSLYELFKDLNRICRLSNCPIVLMVDEVDSASNNQVFLDFLAQLRSYYLERETRETVTFQSVILAGLYDVKSLRAKIRPESAKKTNSPWNIAADFDIDLSFSETDIAGMLKEYENDHHTGMALNEIAALLYAYTSGYPFLVSRLCKLIDEKIAGSDDFPTEETAWTKDGFLAAVRLLLSEENTLFESLDNKLIDYPELKQMLKELLLSGKPVQNIPGNQSMRMAVMFGFATIQNGLLQVANRIFETRLYDGFLAEESRNCEMSQFALAEKNQFIKNGLLDVDLILDFHGRQTVIELKVWRGNEYNSRGEKQLSEYLDYYHLNKGYMVSFNFNKKKQTGVQEITLLSNKVLVEAVV